MRLSILDQAPISTNQTPHDALSAAMKLAQAGEKLGYSRFWIAEHHNLPGLACPAPEVMLSYIGANTKNIRIGSGAVLLPHYKPYKVAEVFNLLSTLFPGRIDLGIGRAPGGTTEATNALSDHFLQNVWSMPEKVRDLVHFLDDDFPSENPYAKLSAAPIPPTPPVPWLLGTGKKSAMLAAEYGISFAFGLFMSDSDGTAIIQQYKEAFKPRKQGQKPEVIVTVSAICAETNERAEELALSPLIWSIQRGKGQGINGVPSVKEAKKYELTEKEQEDLQKMKQNMIIGNPQVVCERIKELQAKYQADEMMIVTITHNPQDKIQSYRLIADELLKYKS
ncbi:LLM class flavin-dependent oxidoreductase [Neobacillus mesonae]|uniref:LLM class flavin-dependent oxidoreductase n=1 Tax=Neobacillus mesonae TaxID=1193713 RepID=UPI00203D8BB8|nr:LLM class flavin-dependent oxidoreductase [Neobacillus mesonae]MCM3567711.1 LLM class flavin-dependent oxidoreductase [Neobacillus mesonae]